MSNFDELKKLCFLRKSSPEVIYRLEEVDHEQINILHNYLTQETYVLQKTNVYIWELLDGTVDVGEIIVRLQQMYPDIPEEQVKQDVVEFIKFLWERQYIRGAVEN